MFRNSGLGRSPVVGTAALMLSERNRCTPRLTRYSTESLFLDRSSRSTAILACSTCGERISGAMRIVLAGGETARPLENGLGYDGLVMTVSRSRIPSSSSDRSVADRGRLSEKIPAPPRNTVLAFRVGANANARRGAKLLRPTVD